MAVKKYFGVLMGFAGIVGAVTLQDAEESFSTLQQWYDNLTGLWIPSTGWWNSANCLTVIADLAAIDDNVRDESSSLWGNTFSKAQGYNLQMTKVVGRNDIQVSYYANSWPSFPHGVARPRVQNTNGFLNGYYDDEGWWALAWIAVYDVTKNPQYLQTACSIFEDMDKAYGTTPCGGMWWDKKHTYVNAIVNELYIDVAAHLAVRPTAQASNYLERAKQAWDWFQQSGLINAQWTINDGLDSSTCANNHGTVWTYNQGVILGALVELSRATGQSDYIDTAKLIADAALKNLTDSNGILHDPCEPDCGGDGSQFKGIFARNLGILQTESPEQRYREFLERNANSVWQSDRNGRNELGLEWDGPFVGPANASTQSSGMDVLVAALSM